MAPDMLLVKAEFPVFLKQYTVHKVLRNNNRFNLGAESIELSISEDKEFCYFIYLNNVRIGGVILRKNAVKHPFLFPEYQMYLKDIIKAVHQKIIDVSDKDRSISCLPSNSEQAAIFEGEGYKTMRKLLCMIGSLNSAGWSLPQGFLFRKPTYNDMELIIELFYKANIDEPWHQPVTVEGFRQGTGLYFDKTKTDRILGASSLCFNEATGEAVGGCMVSMNEGYPFIFDLHVHKDFRRRGIASAMMKKAINQMSVDHDFMRLFVADGNPAKKLYEKLGFIAGEPVYVMKYDWH